MTGSAEAIEATWPQATVQTCVVHLIRAAMRFVAYGDHKQVAAALKPIYQASSAEAALTRSTRRRLGTGPQISLGGQIVPRRLGAFTCSWRSPPELRRVIYTPPTASSR